MLHTEGARVGIQRGGTNGLARFRIEEFFDERGIVYDDDSVSFSAPSFGSADELEHVQTTVSVPAAGNLPFGWWFSGTQVTANVTMRKEFKNPKLMTGLTMPQIPQHNRNSSRKSPMKRLARRDGVTIVEMAFVGPVFFVMIFASIEFCRLNMIRNLTQDAAYFAARDAMVPGATAAEATAEANRILAYLNTKEAEVVVNDITDDSDEVSVTISVPVAANSYLIPQFVSDLTFTATATMRTERYDGYYDPYD